MEYVKDPLTQEIDAMAIIGQLLGKLPDAGARQRVLQWAAERYGSEVVTPQAKPVAAALTVSCSDAGLAVDSLTHMFSPAQSVDDDLTVPEFEAEKAPVDQPVQSALQSFVKEFRRFADEWKGAAA